MKDITIMGLLYWAIIDQRCFKKSEYAEFINPPSTRSFSDVMTNFQKVGVRVDMSSGGVVAAVKNPNDLFMVKQVLEALPVFDAYLKDGAIYLLSQDRIIQGNEYIGEMLNDLDTGVPILAITFDRFEYFPLITMSGLDAVVRAVTLGMAGGDDEAVRIIPKRYKGEDGLIPDTENSVIFQGGSEGSVNDCCPVVFYPSQSCIFKSMAERKIMEACLEIIYINLTLRLDKWNVRHMPYEKKINKNKKTA